MSDETTRLKNELADATARGDKVAVAGLRYVIAYNEAGDDLDAQVEASDDIEKALSNTEHARILRRSAKAAIVMADELEAGEWTIPADKQEEIDARALDLEKRWDAKGIEKAFVTEQQLKDAAAANKCPKCGEGSLRRQPGRDGEDVFACSRGPLATGRGCGYNEQIEKAFVIPGQVPRKSPAMSLDELTAMPAPVNMAVARLAQTAPVHSVEGVTNGLIEEPTQARAFQNFVKGIVGSQHEAIFRSQLMQHMKLGVLADPILRKALMERALQFYKAKNLTKAEGDRGGHVIGHTSSGKAIYAGEDAKAHAQQSADIGVQQMNAKGAAKKAAHAQRAEHHEAAAALYEHAGRNDAAADQKNAAALHWQRAGGKPTMQKAEPRGGNYHRRVTNEDGNHRYYYSEDDYAKRPDAHLDGATVKKQKAKAAVLAHVGDKGCTVDDLKALSSKHDPEHLADAVRAHVKAGTLKHANGKLMKNDDVKKSEGSRGGHVIGHTGSGKPIYAPSAGYSQGKPKGAKDRFELEHAEEHPFTSAEHRDAAKKHDALAGQAEGTARYEHEQMRDAHKSVASAKEKGFSYKQSYAQDDNETKKSLHGWLDFQNSSNEERTTMKKGIEEGGASAPETKDLSDGANGGTDKVAFVSENVSDDEASKLALVKGGLHAYIGKAFGDPPEPKDADEKADAAEADAEQAATDADSDAEPKEPIEKGNVPPQFQKKPQAQQAAPSQGQQQAPPQKGPPAPPAKPQPQQQQAAPQKPQEDDEDEDQQQSASAPQNGPQGQQAPPQAPPKKKPAATAKPAGTFLPPAAQQMQKGGLHGWLAKSNIPGAEDTSAGKTKGNLVEGGTPALDQGEGVNGPMLGLDGEGKDNTGTPGGASTVAASAGGSDSGKTEVLNSDDPKPGEMNGDDVGIHTQESPTPSGGPLGVGSLSKSSRFMDPADMVAPTTRRWAPEQTPADVRYGVGRPAPRTQAAPNGPQPTVVRKGMTTYTDAADLAVERLQKSNDWNADAVLHDSPLQKSVQCPCGQPMAAYLSVCPSCGSDGSLQKSQAARPAMGPPKPLRLRYERDLALPNGTKIEG